MNYIGSKNKLSSWIKECVLKTYKEPVSDAVFCDLFAGTGAVARNFKTDVKQIIANDVEYYSYALLKNYIGNHQALVYEPLLKSLNQLKAKSGFITEHYTQQGKAERLYFTVENGQKIDAIRLQIEQWKTTNDIDEDTYFFLLATLLESADKVANTASVYGSYLKKIKTSASKTLILEPAIFKETTNKHSVFQEDANVLIKKISGDILYLDPPYNARQYGANYHLLNTIAKMDIFVPSGKTGLREYTKSNYCKKSEVTKAFEDLVANAQFQYIYLSYNNEGLMSQSEVEKIMKRYGNYRLESKNYQRFKADKTENRNHKANFTNEFLHILEKR
ncbi:MAG: modification methylase [Bacteroidetes bacterium HGW-Bacteroidetes-2]|jgi:adenine-specific DNA-methyltransferase|nr:MAG: modification methylase [Bacteroidetes bacterium HGW-Bacteroidetes-2]